MEDGISSAELKKIVASDSIIIGKDETLKGLRTGSLKQVFLAGNCAEEDEELIRHLAQGNNVPVVKLSQSNEDLGLICKKAFHISVLGVSS